MSTQLQPGLPAPLGQCVPLKQMSLMGDEVCFRSEGFRVADHLPWVETMVKAFQRASDFLSQGEGRYVEITVENGFYQAKNVGELRYIQAIFGFPFEISKKLPLNQRETSNIHSLGFSRRIKGGPFSF